MPYFKKNERPAPDPRIWDELKTHSDGLGGAMLDVTELDATKNDGYLIKGCPAYLDFSTKTAHVVKAALVVAGGTTSAPRVSKNHLYKVGDFVYVSGDAVTISAIDTSNSAYDVLTLSAACTGATAGAYLEQASAAGGAVAAVKGIYTMTISTKPAAGDKFSLDGVEYLYAAAEGEGVYAIGADAKAAAVNVEDAVSAQYDGIFSVQANNGKLIFTQLVGGVGAIPVLVVTPVESTGTLAAAIVQTTAGVLASSTSAKYTANVILGNRVKIVAGVTVDCIYKVDQWVEKARIPYPVSAATVSALNPNIILK